MSRQLAVSSTFSVFALAALALLAPGSARLDAGTQKGATIEIAAPTMPDMPGLAEILAD